jgi:hypothetical protein
MAFERRDNSGILSRNDKKQKPNHPDHRGQCTIDGVEYWIGAWIKEGAYGKFFSLNFQRKDDNQRPGTDSNVTDDDVPF